jgi:hypothetical protein
MFQLMFAGVNEEESRHLEIGMGHDLSELGRRRFFDEEQRSFRLEDRIHPLEDAVVGQRYFVDEQHGSVSHSLNFMFKRLLEREQLQLFYFCF